MGRVEIPAKKRISKSSFPVPGKTRGVLNNIPDNVEGPGVWGEGPVLDSLLAGELAKLWKKCTAQVGANRFLNYIIL